MKKQTLVTLFIILLFASNLYSQSVKKIILDEKDSVSGYYLAVEPQGNLITGVLVLLPGFRNECRKYFP